MTRVKPNASVIQHPKQSIVAIKRAKPSQTLPPFQCRPMEGSIEKRPHVVGPPVLASALPTPRLDAL